MKVMDICEIAVCIIGLYLVGLGLLMLYGIVDFDVSKYADPSSIGVLALGVSGISLIVTFRRARLDKVENRMDKT